MSAAGRPLGSLLGAIYSPLNPSAPRRARSKATFSLHFSASNFQTEPSCHSGDCACARCANSCAQTSFSFRALHFYHLCPGKQETFLLRPKRKVSTQCCADTFLSMQFYRLMYLYWATNWLLLLIINTEENVLALCIISLCCCPWV